MSTTGKTDNKHLQIIGAMLLFAGVVVWMRFTVKAPRVQDNRNLDALVAIKPKRTSRPVSVIDGTLVGSAASADSIEVCSGRGGRLAGQSVEAGKPFSLQIPKTSSEDIAVIARSNGRLVAAISGAEVNNFADVHVGESVSVTFATRFVDVSLRPVRTRLFGTFTIGDVTIPIDTKSDINSSENGELQVSGLPQRGFVTFEILNPEYAKTFALTNIALRSDKVRTFPRVKVYPSNELRGKVIDTKGKPVANADVIIGGNVRNFRMPKARTDAFGNYTFARLPNGVYSVKALSREVESVCSSPISQIECDRGIRISLADLTLNRGRIVKFVINDSSSNQTQPVFLKVSGEVDGRPWVMTYLMLRDQPTKILLPKGVVHFSASQQPRNGMMPLVRNINVSPTDMTVDPANDQIVTVRILPRRA
jgi:hypothetical protein